MSRVPIHFIKLKTNRIDTENRYCPKPNCCNPNSI